MLKKGSCPNIGCYFSEAPEGMYMCEDCLKGQISYMGMDELYEMYADSVEEFKCNGTFRRHMREVDPELMGDYELDCAIFEQKMFQIINSIMLHKPD